MFTCDTYNQYIFQHIYTHLNINDVNNDVAEWLLKENFNLWKQKWRVGVVSS